jgi:hypothetical protein
MVRVCDQTERQPEHERRSAGASLRRDPQEGVPVKQREPILGPNAKPVAIQYAVGLAVWAVASWAAYRYFNEPLTQFICYYVTGSCS